MKKILLSLSTISAVAILAVVGTTAYFSDTETSTGNTFTAGTIDIAVDGQNPWARTAPYEMKDMKPSQTDYIDFTIKNVGTNPANVYKTLEAYALSDGLQSEPECVAEQGSWNGTACTGQLAKDNAIDQWINYDMRVELYDGQNQKIWWETIYMDKDNVKLDTLEGKKMYLGMIPAGGSMKVMQSYHLVNETGNKYQGDALGFNIKLDAEQLGASALRLENKEEVNGDLSHTLLADNKYADLTYKVKDREFAYTLDVNGMNDGAYTLISYKEPWPGATSLALANVTVSGGTAHVTGSINLNQDLINAKVWLVPGTYTPGQLTGNLPWNPTNTLFETGLMDYYDSDL